MGDSCVQFRNQIEEYFEFLFRDQGFEIIHTEDSSKDRCLIVLESSRFRLKMYWAPDEANILVGNCSAPISWSNTVDGEHQWWFLRGIAGYLDDDLSIADRAWEVTQEELSHKAQLQELATMLENHFDGIDRLFAEGDWESERLAYAEFFVEVDKRIRQRMSPGSGPASRSPNS